MNNRALSDSAVLVSCVIPAWNSSRTIARAIQSVLATSGIGEVVVVDDGSTDDTAALVSNLAKSSPIPIRLLQQENSGAAAARNAGMQAVDFDWVAFLDADDEMLPKAISGKLAHLDSCKGSENVHAVHGSFIRGDTGQAAIFAETKSAVKRDGIGRAGGFPGGVVSYIFRRRPLLESGGFRVELSMYEDFELILRMIASGSRIVGCNVPGFRRHYTTNSLTRGADPFVRLSMERKFLEIAGRDQLMGRPEIARRRLRNRARGLFRAVMRR